MPLNDNSSTNAPCVSFTVPLTKEALKDMAEQLRQWERRLPRENDTRGAGG